MADEPPATPEPDGEQVAEEGEAAGTDDGLFERLKVVGSAAEKSVGSVTVIDEAELRKQQYSDVQRMLRLVPGVNLQDEEGYGLRPNIGMRARVTRSSPRQTENCVPMLSKATSLGLQSVPSAKP